MAVNPNIALAVKPLEVANPMNAMLQATQLHQAQMQMDAYRRAQEKDIARTNAFAQADNDDAIANALLKLGEIKEYSDFVKSRRETQKSELDLFDTSMKQIRDMWGRVTTPEEAIAVHEATHRDPLINKRLTTLGVTEPMGRQQILEAAKNPQAFAQFVQRAQLGAKEFMEMNKPISVGSSLMTPQGQVIATAPRQSQLLTPEEESQKTRIALASRPPVQPVAPTITQIVDPSNPNQMITIDARRYAGGSIGSPGVLGVGGKEPGAAIRANKAEEGKTQLANDLDNLRASFTTLDEMRAIPSTERNPLSNIASATAATGVGQATGRFFGTEAQVEREIINSARTRLVNSIKNATGMSAQQLNSNVELQTMLKSISDPGQPIQAALRIIDDIENAYVKGAGMPSKKPGAGGKPPVAPPPGFVPDKPN